MNKRSISGYLEEDGAGGESRESTHVGHLQSKGHFCRIPVLMSHLIGNRRCGMQTHGSEEGTSQSCLFPNLLHRTPWPTIGNQKYASQLQMMRQPSTAVAPHIKFQVATLQSSCKRWVSHRECNTRRLSEFY